MGVCLRIRATPLLYLSVYGTQRALYDVRDNQRGHPGVVIGALTLGLAEDFVCTTYFACALWLFDTFKNIIIKRFDRIENSCDTRLIGKFVNFMVSWLLFVATMAPFVMDLVLVKLRNIRFTFDLVTMAIDEKDHAGAFAVSNAEISEAALNVIEFVIVVTFFSIIRTWCTWADLSSWNPTQLVVASPDSQVYSALCVDESKRGTNEFLQTAPTHKGDYRQYFKQNIVVFVGLVLIPIVVVAISCASAPLVAYSALNTTLNEVFQHALEPTLDLNVAMFTVTDEKSGESAMEISHDKPQNETREHGNLRANSNNIASRTTKPLVRKPPSSWATAFIDYKTELHTLAGDNTLYRRTTGFQGELAFDVNVSDKNPPNVLLLVIESFRYHDSHYLVGKNDPSNLFKGSSVTITPNFDKWAKRGIALRNYWSSWRTSRSLESLLFGQLPMDSVTKAGTSGGQKDTKLSGLPQLFTAKGYETFFTTGCRTDFDSWDTFLPSHGFDTVWGRNEMRKLAEKDLGIKPDQWVGPDRRGFYWGVHDDISFQLLGDLMINKTRAQRERTGKGAAKKPLFLNHYTISSHVDYKQRPRWPEYANNIKNYIEMRYFTDMEFGKFMDRMEKAGVLKDTIVVISGDHGQGPEFGNDVPEDRDVSAMCVAGAIVAEGRLGDAVGMVLDDPTEQYDILNTLADITGVPPGGFEQDGIGRSLKRKIGPNERAVYSNNPTRKMSVLRGHLRLRYDRMTASVLLHDVDKDHDMKKDLGPGLTAAERSEWMKWRDKGRFINAYHARRWGKKCFVDIFSPSHMVMTAVIMGFVTD